MRFEKVLKKILLEIKEDNKKTEEPWAIEITKDSTKSKEYNLLCDLIIKLSILKSKMN
jgi:hypothetical protein